MARRSAQNARYQKHSEPAGKTRKSAAAAKPKRTASSGASTTTSSKGSSAKKREPLMVHPDTPEYKMWRRIWWGLLGTAVALSTVSWFLMKPGAEQRTIGLWVLGVAYAAIAAALIVDWTKLRKLRTTWAAALDKPTSKSAAKKAEKAESAAKADTKVSTDESQTSDDDTQS